MSYADKLHVPFAALLGEDEIAQGKVSLKNMVTGEQTLATPEQAAELVQAKLTELKKLAPIVEK